MDKFEEYKYLGERALNQSQRRQNANQIYLTLNTAIFGVMALLIKDSGLKQWVLLLANFPLFIVGLIACTTWLTIISRFKILIGWHYEQLREIEKNLKGSHKFFTKEWNKFSNPQKEKTHNSFSNLESIMPKLFIGLYLVYFTGMIIAVAFGLL